MNISAKDARYPLQPEDMRQAFDQVFAAPDRVLATDIRDFLAIRVGTRPHALRVTDLTRVEVGRKVVTLPGGASGLLGLATSQGKLIPVYSLELALGFDRISGENNWLAVCGRDEPIGLAFDVLEGYLRIPRQDIFHTGAADSNSKHDQQAVRGCGDLRPVVHLPSILAAIRGRLSTPTHAAEA